MKDYLGNELKIGDDVIFMRLRYRNLCTGRIIHFSKQMVLIQVGISEFRQFPSQVVKIFEGNKVQSV